LSGLVLLHLLLGVLTLDAIVLLAVTALLVAADAASHHLAAGSTHHVRMTDVIETTTDATVTGVGARTLATEKERMTVNAKKNAKAAPTAKTVRHRSNHHPQLTMSSTQSSRWLLAIKREGDVANFGFNGFTALFSINPLKFVF